MTRKCLLLFSALFCFASFTLECEPDEGSQGHRLLVINMGAKNLAHIVVKDENGENKYAFFNMIGNDQSSPDREFHDDVGTLVFGAYQTRSLPAPYDTSVKATYYAVHCPDENKTVLYWRCLKTK